MEPKVLMARGFFFVCATCKKLHRGLARGARSCEAGLQGLKCDGPPERGSYPEYEGPLTRSTMASVCFFCGGRADVGVRATDGQLIGACKAHYEFVRPNSGRQLMVKERDQICVICRKAATVGVMKADGSLVPACPDHYNTVKARFGVSPRSDEGGVVYACSGVDLHG